MPSQLVKCAFGFRSFNGLKTKCVPLSVELESEQGARAPGAPYVAGPANTPICKLRPTRYSISTHILYKSASFTSPYYMLIRGVF